MGRVLSSNISPSSFSSMTSALEMSLVLLAVALSLHLSYHYGRLLRHMRYLEDLMMMMMLLLRYFLSGAAS